MEIFPKKRLKHIPINLISALKGKYRLKKSINLATTKNLLNFEDKTMICLN